MNTKVKTNLRPMKASFRDPKVDMQMPMEVEKTSTSSSTRRRGSVRERKMALQQDVEKLRKRLRHEENVHRALERAFTRPLGALPRLPPYLPPTTLELLAEVAVLEEEVVRLEEQVVHFRQGLYHEAVYISSSKRNLENSLDFQESKDGKIKASKLSPQTEINPSTPVVETSPIISESQSPNATKNKHRSPNPKSRSVNALARRSPCDSKPAGKRLNPKKLQFEVITTEIANVEGRTNTIQVKGLLPSGDDDPNKISESILKCLMTIIVRMSSTRGKSMTETLHSWTSAETLKETEVNDPYGICFEYDKRDIGPYKHLYAIEATSINTNRTTNSVFLIQRLRLLLGKLTSVNLTSLTHQEKLAFWINIYNSCMMNAFLEHGIPESPEMVVQLMQKATINVGGHYLNAISIEHFILRLPYHSKYTFAKGVKNDEITARSVFGLELSEPLVTFALSCGSWSSPAVRIYTGSQVENELEVAKKDYLQAAIGISTTKKMVTIPKLLDWYMLDFAKDLDSLLDWVCLQLPHEVGKEAMNCLERNKSVPLSHCLRVIPYEFQFSHCGYMSLLLKEYAVYIQIDCYKA
ncbi:ternary complex factor MIP1, leucine-zipper [Artemisia annua]|uniref:Ternary complex factor MIP1, leucine-zipper n=1 Tax=Artemisia annua TaxID=35608 RepID=A0A2U1PUX7_ARTAN|nr:ternary complex factor MIP1, leucine-zipper [Artemisia annua]